MNLAQRDDGPQCRMAIPPTSPPADCADFMQERSSIAFDGALGIILGEAEVQIALAVCARESAHARGKTMDQPGKFTQVLSAKNVEFGLLLACFLGRASRASAMYPE